MAEGIPGYTPPKKRTGRRHSDPEVLRRREAVRLALVSEKWTPAMRAKLCEHFDVGDWQLLKDKQRVLQEREAEHDDQMRIARMRMVEKYRHVYSLALDAKELRTAVQALRGEARALGVDVHRIEVEHTGGVELTVTGAEAIVQDPVAHARALLDPANQAWARAVLAQAKEPIPGVVDVPVLEDHGANGHTNGTNGHDED